MPTGFSFEGALSNAFRAAHFRTFPWIFAATNALVMILFMAIVGYLSKDTVLAVIESMEALENTNIDEDDPGAVLSMVFGTMTPLIPWVIVVSIGSWVLWAMFEAASQRRYIRGERFSLRLGSDEFRMMAVGLFWWLFTLACFGLPALSVWNGVIDLFQLFAGGVSENEFGRRMIPAILGGLGLTLLSFPVYVFFATRLSPCFAMTIKDRKIVFFDAWNVSRGRFWPILGAFLIIAVAGVIVSSILDQVLQFGFAGFMSDFPNAQSGEEAMQLVFSATFLVPLGLYIFVSAFISALQQHFNGAPAAFAARHDPRGGVDDIARMAVFD